MREGNGDRPIGWVCKKCPHIWLDEADFRLPKPVKPKSSEPIFYSGNIENRRGKSVLPTMTGIDEE
jgi:hypothetical protein